MNLIKIQNQSKLRLGSKYLDIEYFMQFFLTLLVGRCSLMMVLLKRLESLRLAEDAGSQLEVPAVSSLVQPTSPDKTNQHSCQTLAEEQTCAIAAVVWSR